MGAVCGNKLQNGKSLPPGKGNQISISLELEKQTNEIFLTSIMDLTHTIWGSKS